MHWFMFGILALLFLFTPYNQGLYFINDFYSISLILLFLFIILYVRLLLYKEIDQIKTVQIVLLLPLCYLLSIFVAESPESSWNMLIRWMTYTSFFLLLYWSTQQMKVKKWMPVIFQLTGIWMALHMLFINKGWLSFSNSVVAERFAGVFQYPNTFGMIMALFFIFSLAIITDEEMSTKVLVFYSFPLVIYFVCFLLAYSRGMFLILPFVWFIGLLLFSMKKQVEYAWNTVVTSSFAFIVFRLSLSKGESVNIGLLLLMVIISVLLIIGGKEFLNRKIFNMKKLNMFMDKKTSRFLLPLFVLVMSIALVLDLKNDGFIYQALPENLQVRVDGISTNSATAQERLIFIEDAFEISKHSPIIGFGGEAWATIYKKYQQTPYISNKIHNGYMEWFVDNGWLGMIVIISVFSFLFYKLYHSSPNNRHNSIHTSVVVSLLTVFIHSFIDFNFSYGTIWFIVFWLIVMGTYSSETKKLNNKKQNIEKRFLKLITVTLSLFTIVLCISFVFSFRFMHAAQDFNKAKQTESLTSKKELLEEAVRKNPYNTTYMKNLSDVYILIYENYNEIEFKEKAIKLIEKNINLEPNNPDVWVQAATLAEKLEIEEQAIHYYDEALKIDYFNKKLYERITELKVKRALSDIESNIDYAESAINDYKEAIQLNKKLLEKSLDEAFNSRDFEITPKLNYYGSLAYFLLEDYEKIIQIFQDSEEHVTDDLQLRAIAILAYENMDEEQKAQKLYDVLDKDKLVNNVKKLRETLY